MITLYLIGREAPAAITALGVLLMVAGVGAACWVAGNSRIGGDR